MKKNLKKVISAVLSLALAASSFVAMNVSAATFADVADTASYAEAVNALAALGAISGYEDGTFQPNNNITRAEVATMVVAALNMTADAQNSGSTTQFADVNEKAAWAAGYVNVGVAQGYISGMSATEFAPQDNVTYAQILSMLTRILGYGEFAEARGGWPNGYLTAAATAGILSGVSAGANDAVTRAQVAQLIWNAIQAPVLDITTFSTSNTGSEMQKMDGKDDRAFKTPLSDKFDAYVLNVTVEATSKTLKSTNGPEITMKLTNNNDWDPETEQLVKNVKTTDLEKTEVAVGNTAAESYLFSSAKVVATYIDDEWELVYFAPTAKVAQKEVDGSLVADNTFTVKDDKGVETDNFDALKIKKSKTTNNTTNYKLTSGTEVYVNGVEFCKVDSANKATIISLLKNSIGNTILVEDPDKSGYYNRIMVEYAIVGRLNQIQPKSDSITLSLAGIKTPGNVTTASAAKNTVKILNDEIEDGTKTVYVEKNGQVADLAALAKEDIVLVKYDISGSIEGSSFIDIYATTDVITGKYYSYDAEEDLYSIGEAEYEAVADMSKALENGTSYTFKLDPMGRLYDYEVEAESKNFAIVERFVDINNNTSTSSEYSYIQVMTLDGQSKTLYIESDYESEAASVLTGMGICGTIAATAEGYKDKDGKDVPGVAIKDRVIEYSVKASTGRIKEIKKADTDEQLTKEYNSATGKLGGTLSANALILDATAYTEAVDDTTKKPALSDYKASSLAALTDGVEYDVVLVYKQNSEYNYAIVTAAGATFGGDSNFAVAAADFKTSSKAIVNDEDVYTLDVMENGASDAAKLNISTNVKVFFDGNEIDKTDVKAGAVFFYTTDGDGFVDKISVVYNRGYNADDSKPATDAYEAILNAATADTLKKVKLPKLGGSSKAFRTEDWLVDLSDAKFSNANDEVQLLLAPIFLDSAKGVSVAEIKYDSDKSLYYMDTNTSYDFTVSSDAKIYSFDMSGDTTGVSRFSSGAFAGIDSKDCEENGYAYFGQIKDKDGQITNFDFSGAVQMAFLMVVDGTVTNALVFAN